MPISSRESRYWLQLLDESQLTNIDVSSHLKQTMTMIKILTKIVKTTQERLK